VKIPLAIAVLGSSPLQIFATAHSKTSARDALLAEQEPIFDDRGNDGENNWGLWSPPV
jgi:hypothetical protein